MISFTNFFRIFEFSLFSFIVTSASQPAFEFSGQVGSTHVDENQMQADGFGGIGSKYVNMTSVVDDCPGFAMKFTFYTLSTNLYQVSIVNAFDDEQTYLVLIFAANPALAIAPSRSTTLAGSAPYVVYLISAYDASLQFTQTVGREVDFDIEYRFFNPISGYLVLISTNIIQFCPFISKLWLVQ